MVALGAGIGATGQPDVVGKVRPAGERLLSIDDVMVTIAPGFCAKRCEVGSGTGLGVPDRELDFATKNRWEESFLLLVGAIAHQRRADGVNRNQWKRHSRFAGLIEEDQLLCRCPVLTAVLTGPPDAEPAIFAQSADSVAVGRRAGVCTPDLWRDQLGEVFP